MRNFIPSLLLLAVAYCTAVAAPAPRRLSELPLTNRMQGSNMVAATVFPYPHPQSTNGDGGTYNVRIEDLFPSGATYVDALRGSDTLGDGGFYNPWATPLAAKMNTPAGGTIVVNAGTYRSGITNLWFNGRWHFAGVALDWMGNVLDSGCGLFDERFSGGIPVTNIITGSLDIKYCPGTNVHLDELCVAIGNTNCLGAVVVTNRQTSIQWFADTRVGIWGPVPSPTAFYVKNCNSNSIFRTITEIYNGNPHLDGLSYNVTNCAEFPGVDITVGTSAIPLYWELGTFHFYFHRLPNLGAYSLNAYGTDENDRDDLFLHGDFIDGKMYIVGKSRNWKVWADIGEMRMTAANSSAINCYNAGSHYFRIQKLSASVGPVIKLENPTYPADTNLSVWVDIAKVSGSDGWVHVRHGQLRGRIGHFEQNGVSTGTPGLFCTNSGLISLSGENMACANTAVSHGGGRTELWGYTIRSTNRDPVYVAGAGLRLNSTTLVVGTGATNAIRAPSAQNVNLYGSVFAKSNAHPNVTFTVGSLNVDPDVD
jgi:hypothetical protein